MNIQPNSILIKRLFYNYLTPNEIVPENVINKETNKSFRYLDVNYYLPNSIKFINKTLNNLNIKINFENEPNLQDYNITPITDKNYIKHFSVNDEIIKQLSNTKSNENIILYRVNLYGNKLLDILLNNDQNIILSKSGLLNDLLNNDNNTTSDLYKVLNNIISKNTNVSDVLLQIITRFYNKFKKDIGIMLFQYYNDNDKDYDSNNNPKFFKELIVRKNIIIPKNLYLINCIVNKSDNTINFENIIFCDLTNKESNLFTNNQNYIRYLFKILDVNYIDKELVINPLQINEKINININEIEFDPNDKDEELPVIEIVVNNKTKRFLLGKTNNLYEDDNHLNNLVGKLKFLDDTYTKATVFWSENYLM